MLITERARRGKAKVKFPYSGILSEVGSSKRAYVKTPPRLVVLSKVKYHYENRRLVRLLDALGCSEWQAGRVPMQSQETFGVAIWRGKLTAYPI